MAFDGIVTKSIVAELNALDGARIDKIFQPNKNEIVLGLYLNKVNYALSICIDSQNCRINLTTNSKPNPQVAPNFCMLLRKNLIGLKLKDIFTLDLERLIILDFEGFDEIDDIISKKLIVELMGRHSNIILLDDANIIIDSMRHIKEINQNYRDILPHTKYVFPTSSKYNFLEIKNFLDFKQHLGNIENLNELPSIISSKFNGISKVFINAIINKLKINILTDENIEKVYNYISRVISEIGTNHLIFEDITNKSQVNKITKDYFLTFTEHSNPFELNFFIDDFYYSKETNESFKNYRNTLLKLILDALKKYNKRLQNINEKLKECEDMDKYRIYGELITSNLYKLPNKNLEKVELENYYDNNNLITIKLDRRYLPSINAKNFFKKYSKLKNALQVVSKQKEDTLKELNYLESIVYELETASSIDELAIIFEEISENNIFKDKYSKTNNSISKKTKIKKSNLTKNKTVSFNPIKYNINGYIALVGRNNRENDYLTLKYANKKDLWFHTKDFHGSHTILKIDGNLPYPNEDILEKVAKIAAKHSKAKTSSNVPVDYCEVKFVKKPSGSKPGMVIYTNNKTIYINP